MAMFVIAYFDQKSHTFALEHVCRSADKPNDKFGSFTVRLHASVQVCLSSSYATAPKQPRPTSRTYLQMRTCPAMGLLAADSSRRVISVLAY